MITPERAIEIAEEAIRGKTTPQPGAPVSVTKKGGSYVVTFEHVNPPGTFGPDYEARLTIDAETGAVLSYLGGS